MLNKQIRGPRWVWIGAMAALGGTGLSISAVGIGIAVFAAGLVLQEIPSGRFDMRPLPRQRLLVAVVLSLIISLFISDYFAISLRGFFKYIQGWILAFAFLWLPRKRADFVRITAVAAALYALISVDAIYQLNTGKDFVRGREWIVYAGDQMRLTGPFKHSNDFGSFLVPGIALAASIGAYLGRRRLWFAVVGAGILLACLSVVLVGTFSRGAWMGAAAAAITLSLMSRNRRWWILALAGAAVVAAFMPNVLGGRIRSAFDWVGGGWEERVLLMKTAARMLMAKPWFGVGLNTYSEYFAAYKPADYPGTMYAHNSYLQLAAEAGLVGAMLFFGYIVLCLWDLARRNIRSAKVEGREFENAVYRGCFAGMIGLLANAAVESLLQSTQLRALFWILMGLSWAAAYRLAEPVDKKPDGALS